MPEKVIELDRTAAAENILEVARSVAEGRRYLWEPTGRDSARAHEGGKPIVKRSSATKLLLGLRLENGALVLSQMTHGGAGYSANMGPLVAMKVSGEFRKMRKAITRALDKEGLTPA